MKPFSLLSSPQKLLAVTALITGSTVLAIKHQPTTKIETQPEASPSTFQAFDLDSAPATGALLLDFVDPQEGEGSSDEEIANRARSLKPGAELAGPYAEHEHLYRVEGDRASLAALAHSLQSDPLIEGIEAEIELSIPDGQTQDWTAIAKDSVIDPNKPPPDVAPNDPMYPLQWHLKAINMPQAWNYTRGQGAVVAVIDTGVAWKDSNANNVEARAVPDLAGLKIVHPHSFVRGLPEGLDDHAHGTHVAGTIAQTTDNGIGVAGVANQATIMPLKVLEASGRGSNTAVASAIRYAADHGAHVINMSLGGPINSRVLAKSVKYAHDKGVTVVCAAGNSGRARVDYPAAVDGCFAVAATDYEGKRSFYSNWGKALAISAPGGDTRADKNGDGYPDGVLQNTIKIQEPKENDYLWFMGTSMAAPHVAGVAALVVSQGISNPDEVERILQSTAKHPNNVKWDDQYGAGHIDAAAAVRAAASEYKIERSGLAGLLACLGLGLFAFFRSATGLYSRIAHVTGFAFGLTTSLGIFGLPAAYLLGQFIPFGITVGLSAAVPLLATLLLLQKSKLRGFLAGLNLGWSALLLHGALVLPTLLSDIPGGASWDRAWLVLQALLCLAVARRVLVARPRQK